VFHGCHMLQVGATGINQPTSFQFFFYGLFPCPKANTRMHLRKGRKKLNSKYSRLPFHHGSRYRSVGIATGWTTERSEFESWYYQEFSVLHDVHTGSGAHPASYPMCTGDSFPGVKAAGAWSLPHIPTSVEVKNTWIYTSIPLIRLHGVVLN
jgi:hypothetical protein